MRYSIFLNAAGADTIPTLPWHLAYHHFMALAYCIGLLALVAYIVIPFKYFDDPKRKRRARYAVGVSVVIFYACLAWCMFS